MAASSQGRQLRKKNTERYKMGKLDEKAWQAKEYRLFAAIRQNDPERVRAILDAEPDLLNTPAPKRPLDTRFLSLLQVSLCTGWHRKIAWLLLERGADVNYCMAKAVCEDGYPVLFDAVNTAVWNARRYEWDGKDVTHLVMEAVAEANKLCPNVNAETGEDYPGRVITPEMRADLRRILQLLIDTGADRENRSAFSGKTIRAHYENEPVWRICGDLFD